MLQIHGAKEVFAEFPKARECHPDVAKKSRGV